MIKMTKPGLAGKITGTLIITSIAAVLVSTLFMLVIVRQQFSGYINKNNQIMSDQWAPIVAEYYAQNGTKGLQQFLASNVNTAQMGQNGLGISQSTGRGRGMGNGMGMGRGMGNGMGMGMGMRQGRRLLVADAAGIIVADTSNLLIGQRAEFDSLQASSSPLMVDKQDLGTLYVISPLGSGLSSLENDFMAKLTLSSVALAFAIGVIALIIGLVLGKRISSPLAELSTVIHQLAGGRFDKRIQLAGDQEFMELGQDLNHLAQRLEDAENNRRRLTADISHELRTPLTLMRGQLEGMQSGVVAMNSANSALLLDEVIRLARLVKELESLSMLESQGVELKLSTAAVEELLERVSPVSIAMQDSGINFNIDVEPEVKEITADQDRLLQILLNLLSNALHHVSQGGSVTLSIRKQPDGLLFKVADNGPGISPENLPHIFERFYRVDDSRNRRSGGVGLGLAIARGYAEAHKGRMWVESTVNRGTTFYFTLPQ